MSGIRAFKLFLTLLGGIGVLIWQGWINNIYQLLITGAVGILVLGIFALRERSQTRLDQEEPPEEEPGVVGGLLFPAVIYTIILGFVMWGGLQLANLTSLDALFLEADRASFGADVAKYQEVGAFSKVEEIAKERLKMPVSKTWQRDLEMIVYRAIIAQADALPDGEAKEAKYGEAAQWAVDQGIESEEAAAKQQLAHPTPTPTKTPTPTATPSPTPTPAPVSLPEGSTAKVVRTEVVPDGAIFYLKVVDAQGVFVSGLVAKDFNILVDGTLVNARVTDLETAPLPKSVVVAIDGSGSMNAGNAIAAAKDGAKTLLSSLNAGDEVKVFLFRGREVVTVQEWTSDFPSAIAAINEIVADGGTPLYDAIFTGARELAGRTNIRKVLVVLSDGADSTSLVGLEQVLTQLPVVSPEMYVIGLETRETDYTVIERIAASVGGTLLRPQSVEEIPIAFGKIAEDVGQLYAITVDVPNVLVGEHTIEIRIGSGPTMYTIILASIIR